MRLLGIDPGSRDGLGWALFDHTHFVESGVLRTDKMPPDNRAPLWRLTHDLIVREQPGVVAYERVYRHSGVHAAHIYGGIVATIQHACIALGIPWVIVPVGAVKRVLQLRASGRDKRKAGVDAAHALGYTSVTDHNEADAIGVALAGIEAWKNGKNVYGN